jgi:hypothetical protein
MTGRLGPKARGAGLAAAALLLAAAGARAHEPISADAAIGLVEEMSRLSERLADEQDPGRAEAACVLGARMTFVVQVLNRDLAAHGDQGMSAAVLASQLSARGMALKLWPEARRYRAYLAPLEACVALAPVGPARNEALFELVRGRFYDSFIHNPLEPVDLDWPRLRTAIVDAESLNRRALADDQREEAAFILAIDYLRAARMAPESVTAAAFADLARGALVKFPRTFPDSMRAAATEMLLGAVPTAN